MTTAARPIDLAPPRDPDVADDPVLTEAASDAEAKLGKVAYATDDN